MKPKRFPKLHAIGLILLLFLGTLLLVACDPPPPPPNPQPPAPNNGGGQPPPAEPRPDLEISAIEVLPGQPDAGVRFAVNVYVRNNGQAASGEYDVAIFIKDVGRDSVYPVGTFRQPGLQPGENVVAYSSTDRLVNDPGSFQVHVEIVPFLFEDGNAQNNTQIWAFMVN